MSEKADRLKRRRIRTIVSYGVLGALVVALALYLVFRNTDRMQYDLPETAAMDEQNIESIRIVSEENGTIELAKSGDTWYVGENRYKTDSDKLQDILDAVTDFELTELVSTAEFYKRYELDEESRYEVIVSGAEGTLLRFDVGKQSPTYNHTYVRLSGDDRVYQATGNLKRAFEQDVETLRNKVVLTLNPANVLRIGVTTPEESFRLFRSEENEETVWTSNEEEQWDPEAISDALERLVNLECRSFIDGDDLGTPKLVLDIQSEEEHRLTIFAKDGSTYPAQSSQSDYTFTLSSYVAEKIIETFSSNDVEADG